MIAIHASGSAKPIEHQAYRRFVAVLDVLGMKSWLEKAGAQDITMELERALARCRSASAGVVVNGGEATVYDSLIGVTHVSDTLLFWSPDDSWASFAEMVSAVKSVVAWAFRHGVPLRGSIAMGEAVCNQWTMRFVGKPIVEAYLWAEKSEAKRKYASVGVDLTPETIEKLRSKMEGDPVPDCWREDIDPLVIDGTEKLSAELVWYGNLLFVNHWLDMSLRQNFNPSEAFWKRDLCKPGECIRIDSLHQQMLDFIKVVSDMWSAAQMREMAARIAPNARMADHETRWARREQQTSERLRLNEVRVAREPKPPAQELGVVIGDQSLKLPPRGH